VKSVRKHVSVELTTSRLLMRDFELGDFGAVHAFVTDLAIASPMEWCPTLQRRLSRFCARREQVATFLRVCATRSRWSTPDAERLDRVDRAAGGQR
jgi:hypothetical protein